MAAVNALFELDGTRANKAQLIAHVLTVGSLARTSTVMFGDRSHDVAGALANGVRPIGVLWGYGTKEELAKAGATARCETPSQIAAVLSAQ